MNRRETRDFYTAKLNRATAHDSKVAYKTILHVVLCNETMDAIKNGLNEAELLTTYPARRAIYRKALREMEI